jgi:GMP reductase
VGVDFIKVGIGPGSVCTTRKMTGVGYPQFSAVAECAAVATNIVADGGIINYGDISKAFGAGACAVMVGSLFAGHDEGGGETIKHWEGGESYKRFYGMASKEAQHKHHGGLLDYRASEGKEVLVPYKGPVENTIKELLGSLRSSCSYIGVDRLEDLYDAAQFVRVNRIHSSMFNN